MAGKLSFFPVGNGDMTLSELESGRNILIDMDIRSAADDPNDDTPDVVNLLRERLEHDPTGRVYVDVWSQSRGGVQIDVQWKASVSNRAQWRGERVAWEGESRSSKAQPGFQPCDVSPLSAGTRSLR